jgi:integrase
MAGKRRAPGEGGVYPYETKTMGTMYYYKCQIPDPATGGMKPDVKRGFKTKTEALKAMREVLAAVDKGTYAEPSKVTFGAYLTDWLDGLRLKPSTVASYRKNVRLHVAPYLGEVPLAALNGPKLSAHYKRLEIEGRKDGKPGGLKARTVLYIHNIIHRALKDAVNADMLMVNPADKANPPTAAEAKAPEMTVWTSDELRIFLEWSKHIDDPNWTAWLLAAVMGCRRGELLALRWKDVDFDGGRISIRRAVQVIKHHGDHEEVHEGPTKSGKSRVVDVDPLTMAVLKAYRKARGEISLALRGAEAKVFGTVDDEFMHPERFSRTWRNTVARYNRQHRGAELPSIHLHEMRHTSATLMLAAGEHPKVASERLGHSQVGITLNIYSHAVPSLQRDAATRLGSVVHGTAA